MSEKILIDESKSKRVIPAFLIQELRRLDALVTRLREKNHISAPGAEIFQWECGEIDEDLIVIADGYGGASLQHVEGDGDNRIVKASREYDTEQEALDIAGKLMGDGDHGYSDKEFDEVFNPSLKI